MSSTSIDNPVCSAMRKDCALMNNTHVLVFRSVSTALSVAYVVLTDSRKSTSDDSKQLLLFITATRRFAPLAHKEANEKRVKRTESSTSVADAI